jgi:hypothetical protein
MRSRCLEKNEKGFAATGYRAQKNRSRVDFDGLPASVRQKKIKPNRTLRPKGQLEFEFRRFRRFCAGGREKIVAPFASRAAAPPFRRFSKRTQRLGALLASLPCARIAGKARCATILEANWVAPL